MRTIQFDHEAIQEAGRKLTESAVGKLRVLRSDVPLMKQHFNGTLASDVIPLRDVLGREKRVKVIILHRFSGKPDSSMAGGRFIPNGHSVGVDLVEIFYNSEQSPSWFQEREKGVLSRLTSEYMLHEFTHAADVLGDINDNTKYLDHREGLEAYFNQPAEFRAYAKEIVLHVLEALPGFNALSAESVEALLEKSHTWKYWGKYFNRRHQNRLRQMLVREIQDSGRTIEGADRDARPPCSAP